MERSNKGPVIEIRDTKKSSHGVLKQATGIFLSTTFAVAAYGGFAGEAKIQPTILSTQQTAMHEFVAVQTPTEIPAPTVTIISEQTPIPKPYSKNLYDSALVLYQNPDWTACIPASTIMMLNFIAKTDDPGVGFKWKPTKSYNTQEEILAWEHAHDTRLTTLPGTDAHGWRNGLNQYGWGDIYTDPDKMVYTDQAFDSYDSALKAIVIAIARYNKPVGILAWHGNHAQIITGYEVKGEDPAVSSDFTVDYIYLTDPLKPQKGEAGLRNARILNFDFRNYYGNLKDPLKNRYLPFDTGNGSPNDDPYTPGITSSNDDWVNRWVIVAPVR